MRQKRIKSFLIFAAAAILLIILDQWTKSLAEISLKGLSSSVPVIPGIFELVYVENRGAAFGILQNQMLIFYIVTPLVLLAVLYVYLRTPLTRRFLPLRVICILLFAGAVGNLIDRMVQGYVIDFFYFVPINFPVFNVADCYVTVATVLLFIFLLFVYKEKDLEFLFFRRRGEGAETD